MSGQQIGTVVGFAIGAYFGMPQLGAAIGGIIGGVIDPTKIEGPHIGDGSQQSSAEGVPIAWILGVGLVQGNLVQKSARREVKKEDDGKGGPVQVTFEAHQDFAIMICESSETRDSVMVGVQMVKCNGKIVYDVRPGKNFGADNAKFMANVTFYNGAEDQLPDPTLEAITGVGNTPAYRGVFLAVFRDINLTQYGDAIPTYEWVMVSEGETILTEVDTLRHGQRALFANAHWPLLSEESRYTYDAVYVTFNGFGLNFSAATINEIIEHFEGYYPIWGTTPGQYLGYSHRRFIGSSSADVKLAGYDNTIPQPDVTDRTDLTLVYNFQTPVDHQFLYDQALMDSLTIDGLLHGDGTGDLVTKFTYPPDAVSRGMKSYWNQAFNPDYLGGLPAVWIMVTRPRTAPPSVDPTWTAIPDAPGWYLDQNGHSVQGVTYTPVTGVYKALSEANSSGNTFTAEFEWYEHEPILEFGDPNYSDEPFWTAAYNAAVLAGTLPAGWTYDASGVHGVGSPLYPIRVNDAWFSHQESFEVRNDSLSVATAIRRICKRGGVASSQIDTTEVTQTLLGYPIQSEYNATDCLRPLLSAYSLYGSEYDLKVHFRIRGAAVAMVVNPDDIAEGKDESDETTRKQSKEYPRKILLSYIDIDQDFTVRPQTRQALTPDVRAIGEQSLQIAVVMTADQAAQLADIFYKRSRAAVEGTRKFSIPYATDTDCYLKLTAGEPVGYAGKRYTAEKITLEDGLLTLGLDYDRQSAWTSNVTGIPALPPTPPPSSLNGPTLFAVMNLPVLIDSHDKLGVYIAACGLLSTWRGALVQMSRDDGATWETVIQSLTEASVIGSLIDPLQLAPYPGTDVTNTLHVQVYGGELDSITGTQLLNDGNPAAIVKDDETAEVIQFQTAAEVVPGEYNLTILPRGRLDTTPATHAIGARFVQLESVYFVELTVADIGRTLLFRPVSFGSSPDNNPEYELTFSPAVSQTEWSPAYLTGVRSGDTATGEDLTVSVTPRHRLGTDVMPIASINFTGFRWTFTVGADSYTIDTTQPTYTLTEAQQITSFGSAQASIEVSVSQLNRITGAGPPVEDTL